MATMAGDFAKGLLDRNETYLFGALEGLDESLLHRQAGPDANTIAWLMWHLTRVQDNHVSAMAGKEHAWISEDWVSRFALGLEPLDRGRGHTPQQVRDLHVPSVQLLMDYYRAVRSATDTFLDGLAEADMNRPVPAVSGDGTVPLHQRIEMAVVDGLQHSGQIAYLRGLFQGHGWLSA